MAKPKTDSSAVKPKTTSSLNSPKKQTPAYYSLSTDELKQLLRKRSLKQSGTKHDLVQRLRYADHKATQTQSSPNLTRKAQQNGNTKILANGKPHSSPKEEVPAIVLWTHPFRTLQYFSYEVYTLSVIAGTNLIRNWRMLIGLLFAISAVASLWLVDGPHRVYIMKLQAKIMWCAYWVFLGILSSVGLGTGLHTFLLYLGPHIASVTMAAYECGSLDFPEPPYPDSIACPENAVKIIPTIWAIMSKVRLEAFMWGAGTALGELPPYFMARAARIAGQRTNGAETGGSSSLMKRAQDAVKTLVEKVGFFGILACASIPNPLFDLAGITCGHFLVPFWTFFGATLIGKAVFKMHLQKVFVIIAFNDRLVDVALNATSGLPYAGKYLQAPFKDFLAKQKAKLHVNTSSGSGLLESKSWLGSILEKCVIAMVVYFLVSVINSMAQNYQQRLAEGPGAKNRPSKKKSA